MIEGAAGHNLRQPQSLRNTDGSRARWSIRDRPPPGIFSLAGWVGGLPPEWWVDWGGGPPWAPRQKGRSRSAPPPIGVQASAD